MHFDRIAIGSGLAAGVSAGVGIQVDETEDEGVHEKCGTLGERVRRRIKTRFVLAGTGSHLNIIRMYVTWSIPVPFMNLVSSSVADMNNRPPATRNCMVCVRTCISPS